MTPTQAREAIGLTPQMAAKKARISVRYLRDIEINGRAPFHLAERLARLYRCDMKIFLWGDRRDRIAPRTGASKTGADGRPDEESGKYKRRTVAAVASAERRDGSCIVNGPLGGL